MGGRDTTNALYGWFQADGRGPGTSLRPLAKRFLTFSFLNEEAAFRRSYTLYDRDDLGDPP